MKPLLAAVSFAAVLLLASAWGDGGRLGAIAAPARAQENRVELAVLGVDDMVLAFDLPADFVVNNLRQSSVTLHSPRKVARIAGAPAPPPDLLFVSTASYSSSGTAAEVAHERSTAYGRMALGGSILAEGPVTIGEFEGYAIRVGGDFTRFYIVVPIGDGEYIQLDGNLGLEDFDGVEIVLETGESMAQANERVFDAIVGSLTVSAPSIAEPTPEPAEPTPEAVEPALDPPATEGPPQTDLVESVLSIDQISSDPKVIASNAGITLAFLIVLVFTSTLFNQTLASNRGDIEGWVGRFFTPFRGFSRIGERGYGDVTERWPWVQRVTGPALIVLLISLISLINLLLSPDSDLNDETAVLFLSLAAATAGVTYVFAGGEALFVRRFLARLAGLKMFPLAVAIALSSVLISRLADFQPGFIFGFVAAFALLAPAALDRKQDGQAAFVATIALLAVSVLAWILLTIVRDVTEGNDNVWVGLPEAFSATFFVAGLEGVFFTMIPLSFMHGARIARWNRALWLLMFGVAGFFLWHVLLNQEGAYLDAIQQERSIAAFVLLSFYSVVTLATWVYFRGRVYGWPMPSMPWSRHPRS